jgi:hypothetical protein
LRRRYQGRGEEMCIYFVGEEEEGVGWSVIGGSEVEVEVVEGRET